MIRLGLILLAVGASPLAAVGIALPETEAELPSGAHRDLVAGQCLACRSAEMITTQPRLDCKT